MRGSHQKAVPFFMRTGVQMKNVSELTDARRASSGERSFPYSIAQPHAEEVCR